MKMLKEYHRRPGVSNDTILSNQPVRAKGPVKDLKQSSDNCLTAGFAAGDRVDLCCCIVNDSDSSLREPCYPPVEDRCC